MSVSPRLGLRSRSSQQSDVIWCESKVRVRVKLLAGSKTLRHATVKGLM